jgi:hypothetical protein
MYILKQDLHKVFEVLMGHRITMVPPIYRTSPPLLLVVALSQPKLCPITLCHVAQRFDWKWGFFFTTDRFALYLASKPQPKLCPITLCHVAQRLTEMGVFFYLRPVRLVPGKQAPTEIMSNNVVPRGTTFDWNGVFFLPQTGSPSTWRACTGHSLARCVARCVLSKNAI